MSWFEDIKENTLLKVELDNEKKITIYFLEVKDGIVKGKLQNGKIKKFKEEKIEDLEEIGEESTNVIDIQIKSKEFLNNILEKRIDENKNTLSKVKTSFLNKIENNTLSPLVFKGKEEFLNIKNESKELYSKLMSILNSYDYTKKIKEIDFKYGKSQIVLRKIYNLFSENDYNEIELFLAYILQENDISYFEFFNLLPNSFYCLKNDIYYCHKKNSKYGFIIAEKLFELYYLEDNMEKEWLYLIKNILNFNSFQTFSFQYKNFYKKLSNKNKEFFEESINYIANKAKISNFLGSIEEKIKILEDNLVEKIDYKELKAPKKRGKEKKIKIIKKVNKDVNFNNKYSTLDISALKQREKNRYNSYSNYSRYGNYKKAKDAKDRKDYKTAIKYFRIAFQNNEKVESTIKDLTLTYYESGDIDGSKNFLLQNENRLDKNITTYNFLENIFATLGEYRKSIKYVDILLKDTKTKNKEIILLGKKAFCYIKLNNKDSAKGLLKEILMIQAGNSYAKRLLEEIKIGNVIKDIDISSFGGGLSKFIEYTLSNYEDYAGIASKIKESDKLFTKATLRALQEFIRTTKARPKERANLLLSEAKLIQVLEPDNELYLKTILKRYCHDMALNHMADYSPMEVIRFFYTEASILEIEWKRLVPQVVFYFKTYISNYNELINIQMPSLDEKELDSILNIIILDKNKKIWNNILDMFIWNETITKYIGKKFFENSKFKELSIIFLNELGINDSFNNLDGYMRMWNIVREKRRREYQQWFNLIKSIIQLDNLESIINQIKSNLNGCKKSWLSQTDERVLKTIFEINKNLEDYLVQETFDDKERSKNYILTETNELLNEIKKYPTKFSYEGYKPLLEKIEKLLNQSFSNILKESIPDTDIGLLGESVVVNQNSISLQFFIKNSKNSSPISNVKIEVMKTNDIKYISGETEIYGSIRGDDEKIIKLNIKVSNKIISNLATDIGVVLNYNIRATDERKEKIFQIPIRLYTSEKFEKIDNVYAPVADGGPVTDKSMFFGRDEYIGNIVNSLTTSNSKSIIVYGQKRSGKSSVLYHLKNRLQKNENAFCIDFSMGDIIDDLSVNSVILYYQILSKIEEELEILEFDGYQVPNFKKPTIDELNKNPTIIFYESLREFKKLLSKTDGWKNKKLIILIDEFTYVYTSILKNELSSNFMKTWKAFIEKNYFSAVLVGQDVTPKFKTKYPNEFGVTEDKRLTYLTKHYSRELIEKPIWDKERDSSRYIGNAVDKIIDYTACSPYYLQMFCARIVDYMNRKKAISVTEADIEEIAETFIEGAESLTEDKFDNLFTAGDADVEAFDINNVKNILKQIAKESSIGSCARENISIENQNNIYIDKILKDLKNREVINQKDNYYKIEVGLFAKWLLKH